MVLPNPRQTYKALLLNYDALLEASDSECCYSLSEREVQILLAFVDYTGWITRYEATLTDIDQSLILQWQGNLARKLMTGCCPDDGLLKRFTSDGVFETSDDGGVTWTPAPDQDPRNETIEAPPIPGEDGEDKKCNAAASGMNFVKNNFIDVLNDGMAYGEVTAVAAGAVALLGVTGIGILLAAITGAIMLAGVLIVQAAFTSEVWADFQCILYCNMEGDASFTIAGWTAVKAAINSTYTGVVQIILWGWVNSVGNIGLTNAVRTGIATDDDCSDCDCPVACNDADLIQIGTVTEVSTYDGHPGMEVEATAITGGYAVRWGTIDGTVPPNQCCYLFATVVLEGSINSSYWTDCAGAGHASPAPEGHDLGHFDYYFLVPAKIRILFGA